ncbi:hypothetical protein Fmac_022046 [Flemingia macrophylla]|uniref:At1g61320/AtMIF1 LRR domain-containing protein n=1 Tax=Flemingia macrophylla TaxID=520843 RepID=A0ABD1LYL1_9FABA
MRSLRVLRLASVDVSGEVLECFLATCPMLETIRVVESKCLARFKVWGQGLKLKHLELVECNILYLDVCAPNLVTFRYPGDYGKFNFASVPRLEEVFFRGRYASYLQLNMQDEDCFRILLQLVNIFHVMILSQGVIEGLPVFDNVRQLELKIPHFLRSNLVDVEHEWKANLKQEITVDPLSSYHVDRSPDVKARIRDTRRDSTIWFVDALKPHVPPSVELILLWWHQQ